MNTFSKIFIIAAAALTLAMPLSAKGVLVGKMEGKLLTTGNGRVMIIDPSGKIIWKHRGGNCSDIWMLPDGNILFADNNVREIDPKTGKQVFLYKPAVKKGGGAFSCQRLKNGNTLVGENSTCRILEVDKKGKIVFKLQLPLYKPGRHQNLRMVRKLENGNYLVCHSGPKLVREYTPEGKVVFEAKVKTLAFSALRLPDGNTLVGDLDRVVEFNPEGKQVWELDKKQIKDVKIGKICGINVLPNTHLLLGIYAANRSKDGASVLEITRKGKIIWRYYNPKGDRAMMSSQMLDNDGKPLSNLR